MQRLVCRISRRASPLLSRAAIQRTTGHNGAIAQANQRAHPFLQSASIASDSKRASPADSREARLRALAYRSRQWGLLELDLIVGKWADENLANLSDDQLNAFELLLREENPDIWQMLSGQLPPSQALASNAVFAAVRATVQESLNKNSPIATRSAQGARWVHGWDDTKRAPGGPTSRKGEGGRSLQGLQPLEHAGLATAI
eukprot:jgi/Mesvir1/2463/Mv09994-RA.1